jgi:hypothetical protein
VNAVGAVVEWLLGSQEGLALFSATGSPLPLVLLGWLVVRVESLHRRQAKHVAELEQLRTAADDAAHRLTKLEVHRHA